MAQRVIALLGRRDKPTDAVEEYCARLGSALSAHGVRLELQRVAWYENGWSAALHDLQRQAALWTNINILVQYTALAWSKRGFPIPFLRVLTALRRAGTRVITIFHDPQPFSGTRSVDRIRRNIQVYVMRRAVRIGTKAVFTVPLDRISWLNSLEPSSVFIPIGPNLRVPNSVSDISFANRADQLGCTPVPTIAVFTMTEGDGGTRETREIIAAVRYAAERAGQLDLLVFGRGAKEKENALREGLCGAPARLHVEGLLEQDQLIARLTSADVLLFVRGPISSGRGSALAGVACGLPVVGYEGPKTAAPVTEAGVVLIPYSQSEEQRQRQLNEALWHVLSDNEFRAELVVRSRRAFVQHFSWDSIASQFVELLNSSGD
jgi:glycosyltransferase involved in cell wall biosynthesis